MDNFKGFKRKVIYYRNVSDTGYYDLFLNNFSYFQSYVGFTGFYPLTNLT